MNCVQNLIYFDPCFIALRDNTLQPSFSTTSSQNI